jgi:hypothetical protein
LCSAWMRSSHRLSAAARRPESFPRVNVPDPVRHLPVRLLVEVERQCLLPWAGTRSFEKQAFSHTSVGAMLDSVSQQAASSPPVAAAPRCSNKQTVRTCYN